MDMIKISHVMTTLHNKIIFIMYVYNFVLYVYNII